MNNFAQLSVHKLYLPREFHDYLHAITEPIEPPDPDAMHARVEGWNVAVKLFQSTGGIGQTLHHADARKQDVLNNPGRIKSEDGIDHVANEWYIDMMRKHFTSVHRRLGELKQLPTEFRFIDPYLVEIIFDDKRASDIAPEIIDEFRGRIRWIGGVVTRRSVDARPLLSNVA